MTPEPARHADDASPPAGDSPLFTELMQRCREHEEAVARLARDADAILARYEEQARDAADRILIEARIEAARLLTEARREVSALGAQVESLRRAQREAAEALQHTRRALDGALGAASLRERPRPVAPLRAPARVAVVPPRARWPAAWLPGGSPAVSRRIWMMAGAAAAAALLAVAAFSMLPAPRTIDSREPDGAPTSSSARAAPEPVDDVGAAENAPEARRAAPARPAAARARTPSRQASGAASAAKPTSPGTGERPRAAREPAASRGRAAARTAKPAPPAAAATTGAGSPRAVGTSVPLGSPPRRAARDADGVEQQILAVDRQWFEAYYRGDQPNMTRLSAEGFAMADARGTGRKALPGSAPERVLHDVRVDVHGDGAVLSGRMIERVGRGPGAREHESFLSEVWVRRDGRWQLLGIRLASGDQVRKAAGSLTAK